MKTDWSRVYSQYTMACEVDMITQCLQQILGYYFKFKVCPMSAADTVLKYIKVHTATRWTIRHSLKLHWFADLMKVTEVTMGL